MRTEKSRWMLLVMGLHQTNSIQPLFSVRIPECSAPSTAPPSPDDHEHTQATHVPSPSVIRHHTQQPIQPMVPLPAHTTLPIYNILC